MKQQQIYIFILVVVVGMVFFSCEAIVTLFHGPEKEETHTVTFDANGASGTPPVAVTVKKGAFISLPDRGGLNRDDNVFGGWNENPNGAGITFSVGASTEVTGNVVFYAQWFDESTPLYTVTFNANGSTSGSPPVPNTAYSGTTINIPNNGSLDRSGWTFGGWNTLANGGGTNYLAGASFTLTENITLYANWQSHTQFTVTYNANGASGTAPQSHVVNPGTVIALPGPGVMNYTGREFHSWNSNAEGTGTSYTAGASYTVNANATLYAQWNIVQTRITPSGSTLAEQLAFIRNNTINDVLYEIVIEHNDFMAPTTISAPGRNTTVKIRSADPENPRYIQLESAGSLFTVEGENITLVLEDIIIRGITSNNSSLIRLNSGSLIMNSGSVVTGNRNMTNYSVGVGIRISGGRFEMNEGAEIVDNQASGYGGSGGGIGILGSATVNINGGLIGRNSAGGTNSHIDNEGGGIYIGSGTLNIRGGLISENSARNGGGIAGGYSNSNITITMTGGVISKNQANRGGGLDIYPYQSSTATVIFTKRILPGSSSSGVIYGSDSGYNANISSNNRGDAIWVSSSRFRNTTLDHGDEITTLTNEGWGQ